MNKEPMEDIKEDGMPPSTTSSETVLVGVEQKVLLPEPEPIKPISLLLLETLDDIMKQLHSVQDKILHYHSREKAEPNVSLPAENNHINKSMLPPLKNSLNDSYAVNEQISQDHSIKKAKEEQVPLPQIKPKKLPLLQPLDCLLNHSCAVTEQVVQDQNTKKAEELVLLQQMKPKKLPLLQPLHCLLNHSCAVTKQVVQDQNIKKAEELVLLQQIKPKKLPLPSDNSSASLNYSSPLEKFSQDQCQQHEETMVLPPSMNLINEPLILSSDTLLGQKEQHAENQSKLSASDGAEGEDKALQKRVFAIREIVKTEQDYVRDLSLMVNGYLAHMRDPKCEIKMPEDLRAGKGKLVFGNVEQIYWWHRDFFLKALERCVEHPEEVGPLFKKYERKLYMHVLFCKNKPFSEHIVSEYIDTYFAELKRKMGHKHELCDLLILPVQRITRYPLLLTEVFKYTEQANLPAEVEALQQARQTMEGLAKAANDIMDISRLQGFDGKLASQGQLLFHGPLVCCERTSSCASSFEGKELQVFLFEQIIIFCETDGKKTQYTSPIYKYKNHIQMNKMYLFERLDAWKEKNSGGVELFCVESTDPRKPALAFICQASTAEVRAEWIHSLRKLLQMQKDFLDAIQNPIKYQNELKLT